MKRFILMVLLASLAIPVTSTAQPGTKGKRGGHERFDHGRRGEMQRDRIGPLLALADDLELTEEQVEQLKKMRLEFQIASVDQRAEMQKANIWLKALMADVASPEDEVMRAIEEAAGRRAEGQKMKYTHRKEVLSILSESQQEKLKSLRQEHRQKAREFRKEGRRGARHGRDSRRGHR